MIEQQQPNTGSDMKRHKKCTFNIPVWELANIFRIETSHKKIAFISLSAFILQRTCVDPLREDDLQFCILALNDTEQNFPCPNFFCLSFFHTLL